MYKKVLSSLVVTMLCSASLSFASSDVALYKCLGKTDQGKDIYRKVLAVSAEEAIQKATTSTCADEALSVDFQNCSPCKLKQGEKETDQSAKANQPTADEDTDVLVMMT